MQHDVDFRNEQHTGGEGGLRVGDRFTIREVSRNLSTANPFPEKSASDPARQRIRGSIPMLKALFAATAAFTLLSGIALADDVNTTETTRQSTGIGPLKFETDRTVRSDSDSMRVPGSSVQVDKQKTVTHDVDGDTVSRSKSETTTVH